MAKKKKTKVVFKRKYASGEATCGELTKPERWTDNLFKTWLAQKTQLARRLVINEARITPSRFADPDGTLPALEPLPAIIDGLPQAVADRNQRFYEKQQQEREAWLARIKEREIKDGEIQKARVEKLQREREERVREEQEKIA